VAERGGRIGEQSGKQECHVVSPFGPSYVLCALFG
jgi:hypothetical protein